MPSTLHRSIAHAMPVDAFWRVLSSRDYWTHLVTRLPSPTTVESIDIAADTVGVRLIHSIPEAELPSVVTKIRAGDLLIERTITWTNTDGSLTAVFGAQVQGAPASATGNSTVTPDGDTACTEELTGSATVSIPFLGGKIESMIVGNLDDLFDAEAAATDEWYSANRAQLG